MQLSFNQRVLEQNRRFYFTASATLGIDLATGSEQIDALYLKDAFQGNPDEPPLLDVGFPKPRGEFLVSGSYHAPGQTPAQGGEVKAKVGKLEKNLYVFGQRKWKNGIPTEPEEITSFPLIYQNAFGGEGYENNPVGKGFKDGLLPLVEYPNNLVASQNDKPIPASFSALDTMDPRRMQYKGTYEADYKEKYFPGHPEDMDWKIFLLTPEDQWNNEFFKGDEAYEICNMHPEISKIKGSFPGLYARCFIKQKINDGSKFGELPMNLDTIWFIPEKMLGLLVFRGVVEVKDDEAENFTHILSAYEYLSRTPRSLGYYEAALEKRINSDDAFLKFLTTSDLIPEDHKCAMELLFEMGQSEKPEESQFVKNAEAKSAAMKKVADEKVEEAVKQAEKQMDQAKMSGEKGSMDIKNLMGKKSESEPDTEIKELYEKMDAIFPGITSGDPEKMDMRHFSFDKLEQISEISQEFSEKKKKDAVVQVEEKINSARDDFKKQITNIETQIEKIEDNAEKTGYDHTTQIELLNNNKKQLEDNLDMLVLPDFDNPPKQPLPRMDSDMIRQQLDKVPAFPSEVMEAVQHVQAQKAAGIADETTKALEEQIKEAEKQYKEKLAAMKEKVEENLATAEISFKDGYLMGAHHMEEGLHPHKEPIEEVRDRFLSLVSKGEDVSKKDWACIDLSGENLEGIDLSGAFLEQVNFQNANLKGANLTKSNLARANLEEADFSGANLEEANIGSVSGVGTNFSEANMKSAKLSKSDFTNASFAGANMENIEALELTLNGADLSKIRMLTVFLIDAQMSDVKFCKADIELSMLVQGDMENIDFSDTVFNRCVFIDIHCNMICYDRADLSNCAFVATAPEKSSMDNMTFRQAVFFQTNLMNMVLKNADFSGADMTKAFFWDADLSGANLSGANAKLAQFRKTKLTGANLDNINLYQGSLAKAHLVNASFKGANLCQADLLRSTITNTDFSEANLDMTLIENWRPK